MADPDGEELVALVRLQQHDGLLAHHVERHPIDADLLHHRSLAIPVRRAIIEAGAPASVRASLNTGKWAILDSNQGPPPYQSGALTD
jgi:hypothetical protein